MWQWHISSGCVVGLLLFVGLLGRHKHSFAARFCDAHRVKNSLDITTSGGSRLRELSVLLHSTVLLRRLKTEDAIKQQLDFLPDKRRVVGAADCTLCVACSHGVGAGTHHQPDQ